MHWYVFDFYFFLLAGFGMCYAVGEREKEKMINWEKLLTILRCDFHRKLYVGS
jgi:hypothetical protein